MLLLKNTCLLMMSYRQKILIQTTDIKMFITDTGATADYEKESYEEEIEE